MVFVMRAEPTHIIISAQQMWNKLIQRNGWRQIPASPGSVLKKQKLKHMKGAFLGFALCEASFRPVPTHQGHPDSPTPLLSLNSALLGQHRHLTESNSPKWLFTASARAN